MDFDDDIRKEGEITLDDYKYLMGLWSGEIEVQAQASIKQATSYEQKVAAGVTPGSQPGTLQVAGLSRPQNPSVASRHAQSGLNPKVTFNAPVSSPLTMGLRGSNSNAASSVATGSGLQDQGLTGAPRRAFG